MVQLQLSTISLRKLYLESKLALLTFTKEYDFEAIFQLFRRDFF